ncbi:MAG TPA: hypothetical protein VFP65_03815 [Anaeromyxobacteraceae bacterium]|nr:hypothetical protein [Anaeromyxobacteraceae bacterium]
MSPPRDPTLRPYRGALWVLYFAVLLVSIGLTALSIAQALREPARPRAQGPLPTRAVLRVCMTELEALYREQNQRAWALGSEFEGPDPLATWQQWSIDWEERVRDLGDRCRLDDAGGEDAAARAELAAARDALRALNHAYAAQVNRFAQEKGDLARAAAESLAHAREAVSLRR